MDENRHVRHFAEWLHDQHAGATHNELSEALNDLVEAVQETGKVGSLTLTVKVKPAARGQVRRVLVSDEIKVRKPEGDRAEAIYFVDDNHNLSRRDPDQPELPLRQMKPANMDADTGEIAEAK